MDAMPVNNLDTSLETGEKPPLSFGDVADLIVEHVREAESLQLYLQSTGTDAAATVRRIKDRLNSASTWINFAEGML